MNNAQLVAIGIHVDASGNIDWEAAAKLAAEAKPATTITHESKDGTMTRVVQKDFTGVGMSAVAKEAGFGATVDGDGIAVDRYAVIAVIHALITVGKGFHMFTCMLSITWLQPSANRRAHPG